MASSTVGAMISNVVRSFMGPPYFLAGVDLLPPGRRFFQLARPVAAYCTIPSRLLVMK